MASLVCCGSSLLLPDCTLSTGNSTPKSCPSAAGVLTGLAFSIIVIFCLCVHLRFWRFRESYGAYTYEAFGFQRLPCFCSTSQSLEVAHDPALACCNLLGRGTLASNIVCNCNRVTGCMSAVCRRGRQAPAAGDCPAADCAAPGEDAAAARPGDRAQQRGRINPVVATHAHLLQGCTGPHTALTPLLQLCIQHSAVRHVACMCLLMRDLGLEHVVCWHRVGSVPLLTHWPPVTPV